MEDMTGSVELLSHLASIGASVSLDGSDLVLNAPKNAITPALRDELIARKPELLELLGVLRPDKAPAERAQGQSLWELSHAQKRIWFLDQVDPGSPVWNVSCVFHIHGRLDETALSRAFSEIVSRHALLRSNFECKDGIPGLLIVPESNWKMTVSHFEDTAAARDGAQAAANKPIDLKSDPVFRAVLCKVAPTEHFLCIAAHHIVCDGWSLGILSRELSTLYQAFSHGLASPLPRLKSQYSDYIAWENEEAIRGSEIDLKWWMERLAGSLPILELPTDRPRPAQLGMAGRRISKVLPRSMFDSLHALARQQEVTTFTLLLAAFKVLLARYTGLDDILVGTVSSYRKRREFEQVVGMFANPVVLRTSLSGNPSFHELLLRVRETITGAFSHDTVPFDRLVEHLHPDRKANHPPLFQVSFAYQNLPVAMLDWNGTEIALEPAELHGARYDISVELWETDAGLTCDFEFKTELFDSSTIQRMQDNYEQLLESILADSSTPIEQLSILPAAERHQLMVAWNGAVEPYPDRPIHFLFEERCEQHPDSPALIENSETITYAELNSQANRIAHELILLGIAPRSTVGILMNRSARAITAMLAILKLGAVYVPLDPAYPEERIVLLLKDAGAACILVEDACALERSPRLAEFECLDVAAVLERPNDREAQNLPVLVSSAELMCILYTSGSTGRPKGIELRHKGLVRLLFSKEFASFGEREAVLHMAPETFDAALLEIWGPLLHGGTCVVYPDSHPSIRVLSTILDTHKVSSAWLTASVFNWIVAEAPQTLAPLRKLYTGGEVLSPQHIRRAQQLLPLTRLFNGYGPTEATTFTCVYEIPREIEDEVSIPIGRPVSNTTVYVLDPHLQMNPIGVPGELYIGGDALARGYCNLPGLTMDRFVPDPFAPNGKLYRSGDIVAYLPDGNLRFLGRRDNQVKVRGHRIELSEIEAAIARYPGVIANAVTVRQSVERGDQLLAWFSTQDPVQPEDLMLALKTQLPAYMLPNRLLALDSMPLLQSGKVDRVTLAAMPLPEVVDVDRLGVPQSEIVCLVAEAMAEILDLPSVAARDDFFALGGHSLLAVQLAARIESLVGRDISPALLFQASTPEAIAGFLDEEHVSRTQTIVPLRPLGTMHPIFCVHLLTDGSIHHYLSLVRALDPRIPVYALCPVDLRQKGKKDDLSLQEMAAAQINEIKRLRPSGPYHLCGYSSGGILAFEIAEQLRRDGQIVSLTLIDSFPPRTLRRLPVRRIPTVLQMLREPFVWGRIAHRMLTRMKNMRDGAERLFRERILRSQTRQSDPKDELSTKLWNAVRAYKLYSYSGTAMLFTSQDSRQINMFNFDGYNNWGGFIRGGIQLQSIPGDHLEVMKQPAVGIVASHMQAILFPEEI